MRLTIRDARWFAGAIWFLSWFELYLEIYRHHHVTLFFLPSPPLSASTVGSHPGAWLRTVLVCSALAPPLFASLLLWARLRQARDASAPRRLGRPFPTAMAAMLFGCTLLVLGTLNQVIRRPPIDVDLTLRTGNGGFIVLGLAFAVTGMLLARRTNRQAFRADHRHS
jgi:hypothetical protein